MMDNLFLGDKDKVNRAQKQQTRLIVFAEKPPNLSEDGANCLEHQFHCSQVINKVIDEVAMYNF